MAPFQSLLSFLFRLPAPAAWFMRHIVVGVDHRVWQPNGKGAQWEYSVAPTISIERPQILVRIIILRPLWLTVDIVESPSPRVAFSHG